MARVQQGDRDAFAGLYDLYAGTVYSVAIRLLGESAAAQDAVQEIFARIWSAAARYDAELGKVASWIVTITRNHCLNRIRSEQRRDSAHRAAAVQSEAIAPAENAGHLIIRQETAAAVRASLASLPADQSEAIRLAFFQNHSHETAAAALNVPLGTLKARIRRGLLRLQEQLQFIR